VISICPVNVAPDVRVQLAAVCHVNTTVGLSRSIPFTVTMISLIVSPSVNLNVPVSDQNCPAFGVYVPVFQFMTKVHLDH